MATPTQKPASPLLVIIAFVTVYIVWGSTYFFIQMCVHGFPPLLLGGIRFFTAGILLFAWCAIKGEKLFVWKNILHAAVSGTLLLFVANGTVIWSEQTLPSAMVAIMVSSAPIWFVVLDKGKWGENFKSRSTIFGLLIGFAGVLLLFGEQIEVSLHQSGAQSKLWGMALLIVASIAWPSGSLYAKYRATEGSVMVNTAWQMIIAGMVFVPGIFLHGEIQHMDWQAVPLHSWLALIYLILFGSIAAFSAYVWLLQVRPATQVSTYAYVNPVIAVILGIFFAHEKITLLQIIGLTIILGSVLLINLAKYKKELKAKPEQKIAGLV